MIKKAALVLLVSAMASSAFAWTCATVYQGENFTGHSLQIQDGARIPNLARYAMSHRQTWNNRISSLIVENGCTLKGYQYNNFGREYHTGRRIGTHQSFHGFGYYENIGYTGDLISSLTCRCR